MVAVASVTGCSRQSAGDVFDSLAIAAENGEREAFLDGFTTDSRVLMDGILAAGEARGALLGLGPFKSKVRAVGGDQRGEYTFLTVRADNDETATVVMRQDRGKWRLDLVSTELLWNRDWALSGGHSRQRPDDEDGLGPKLHVPLP